MRRVVYLALCAAPLLGCGRGKPSATEVGETSSTETNSSGSSSVTTDSQSSTDTGETTDGCPPTDCLDLPPDNLVPCNPYESLCGPGEKCAPYASDGTTYSGNRCVPVLGDGSAGEPCVLDDPYNATDDCDADTVCWGWQFNDGVLQGICTPHCTGTPDGPICAPGTACFEPQLIATCVQTCDPLLQDCDDDPPLGCYFYESTNGFFCSVAGEVEVGEPCDSPNHCAPGNYCAQAELLPNCDAARCCTSFCDLFDPVCDSVPGTECVDFYEDPWGEDPTGVCLIP